MATAFSSSSCIAGSRPFSRSFTSFGPRRWFVGIELDFAAIGDGSPGIGKGARTDRHRFTSADCTSSENSVVGEAELILICCSHVGYEIDLQSLHWLLQIARTTL